MIAVYVIVGWLAAGIVEGLILGPILRDRSASYPPVPDEAA